MKTKQYIVETILVLLMYFAHFISVHAQNSSTSDPFLIGADLSKLPLDNIVDKENLVEPINMNSIESFLTLVIQQVNDADRGFPIGDTLYFSIWDEVSQKEVQLYAVTRKTNNLTNKDFIEIHSGSFIKNIINLKKGWNMISLSVEPGNKDIKQGMETLIEQNALISVQDETGETLENWGIFGGWKNQIGFFEKTEGYKVNVSMDCVLEIAGFPVELPLEIPLIQGWNLISFPKNQIEPIEDVFKPLIDEKSLVKVQNEEGKILEFGGDEIGWINTIINLLPGEAYQVKVNKDTKLVIK